VARQTVYEGVNVHEKKKRTKASFFDRTKILLILGVLFFVAVAYNLSPPFVGWSEALDIALSGVIGVSLLVLMGVEVLRQIHYYISEKSAAYNHFWSERVFGGVERATHRSMSDWTRFRLSRLIKIGLFLLVLGTAVMILVDGVTNPIDGLLAIPGLIGQYAFYLIYFVFIMSIVVFQFVAIFWFLSRGGIDIVYPEDIETRFDSVWGQDHVLDLVKENVAFLEKPDEIEAKGGYIPGGILLWGPPGTGKTLMAEAIAGEVGKPFVFVDPGAFIQMFMGVGILKVKRLFRKLRKLSLQHGGVIVFFDEADSLGSRGGLAGQGPFQPSTGSANVSPLQCNGLNYLSPQTQHMFLDSLGMLPEAEADERPSLIHRMIMGAGMGMGGGGGTLQALLTEMSGLTKPRGLSNRVRRTMGMKPKPPPKYRILIMMATNMPNALDEAMLRPGRIDRMYRVGYPSKEGRLETFRGYLDKVKNTLTEEEVDRLATMTPYYSGAKIKDLINEALIFAIRDDRDVVEWDDIWKARSLKQLGPPEDVEYVERERHAVAIHESGHAVAAHLLQSRSRIDLVSIEKRQNTLGMVAPLPIEERETRWRTEIEIDVKVSLASLAAEKMFFGEDNSSGVSHDLQAATQNTALMEGVWGMGSGITSLAGLPEHVIAQTPDPTEKVVGRMADRIEKRLKVLYDEVYELLVEHSDDVLRLALLLEERKTISGEDVAELMGVEPGFQTAREPAGFAAVDLEGRRASVAATMRSGNGRSQRGPTGNGGEPVGVASGNGDARQVASSNGGRGPDGNGG
jgi:cell division protease FtsH